MEKELITIVLPTKNAGHFLPRFLRSFKNQEGPYELLVIDCLSTDNTLKLVKDFGARIISEQDSGVAESWDKGVKNAKGDIICIFGADDCLMPDAFKIVRNTFESNISQWVVGRCLVFRNGDLYNVYGDEPITKQSMLESNKVPAPSSFFRKDLYMNVSGVDTGLKVSVDYDLWMRFLKNNCFPKQIEECLSAISIHGQNLSVIHTDIMAIEDVFIKNKYRL